MNAIGSGARRSATTSLVAVSLMLGLAAGCGKSGGAALADGGGLGGAGGHGGSAGRTDGGGTPVKRSHSTTSAPPTRTISACSSPSAEAPPSKTWRIAWRRPTAGVVRLIGEVSAGAIGYDAAAAGACQARFLADPCHFGNYLFTPNVFEVFSQCPGTVTPMRAVGDPCVWGERVRRGVLLPAAHLPGNVSRHLHAVSRHRGDLLGGGFGACPGQLLYRRHLSRSAQTWRLVHNRRGVRPLRRHQPALVRRRRHRHLPKRGRGRCHVRVTVARCRRRRLDLLRQPELVRCSLRDRHRNLSRAQRSRRTLRQLALPVRVPLRRLRVRGRERDAGDLRRARRQRGRVPGLLRLCRRPGVPQRHLRATRPRRRSLLDRRRLSVRALLSERHLPERALPRRLLALTRAPVASTACARPAPASTTSKPDSPAPPARTASAQAAPTASASTCPCAGTEVAALTAARRAVRR